MANAVFYHRPDSIYDDDPAQRYHFPKQYLSRVKQTIGDWIIYDGPVLGRKGRHYSSVGLVNGVRPDADKPDHFYADIAEFINFDHPVDSAANGGFEPGFITETGEINAGYRVQAVRVIERDVFARIVEAGLSEEDEWPDRIDPPKHPENIDGFGHPPQAAIHGAPGPRPIISQLVNRPFRDAKFRQHIRQIYDRTCAFTGLRLINGGGRPEVEAAHIVPVEKGGNDSVRNGIALSGTVHWMFDRGLLSLSADHEILPSRHLNYDISHLLNKDMKALVPTNPNLRPHPDYMAWHRENVFKD
ncbi:HNH endonuclease [uncultured Roseibium sp.]|uniref:HNH endonuclease n=1 Tax=uncultured Roseibium sp. TaxID=1936171 RepID=UPI002597DD5B|nr:HNH endonuclease [uncultured Roseibium sp.]